MERDAGMNPRVLLVEDDPTNAAFLAAAAAEIPVAVDVANTCAMARQCIALTRYDAWLFDANLPDGTGIDLLYGLRADGLHDDVPALAHTADVHPDLATSLLLAGFSAVVAKPVAAEVWRAAIRDLFPCPGAVAQPAWNDEVALRALGAHTHVEAMRGLFLAELPAQAAAVAHALASGDRGALNGQLHRLKASCGFVGATGLASAVRGLSAWPGNLAAREAFQAAVAELLGTATPVSRRD